MMERLRAQVMQDIRPVVDDLTEQELERYLIGYGVLNKLSDESNPLEVDDRVRRNVLKRAIGVIVYD